MAVNRNEVVVTETGKDVASVLLGIADLQGYTVHHVRSQERGFAVPESVARAYLAGGVTQPTPPAFEALVGAPTTPQMASQGNATPAPQTTGWTPERRARQAALMREQHQRRKEAALKEADNG